MESEASVTPPTKRITAPTYGIEDVCFTWDAKSNAVRYMQKLVTKIKEHVTVQLRDQATVDAGAMSELKAPVFTKMGRPIHMYCADKDAKENNEPIFKDWEYTLVVDEYAEALKTYKEGRKEWAEY